MRQLRLHVVEADVHVDENIGGIPDLFEEDMDYEERIVSFFPIFPQLLFSVRNLKYVNKFKYNLMFF